METQANKLEAASAALWAAINAGKVGAELSPFKLAVLAAERKAGLRS